MKGHAVHRLHLVTGVLVKLMRIKQCGRTLVHRQFACLVGFNLVAYDRKTHSPGNAGIKPCRTPQGTSNRNRKHALFLKKKAARRSPSWRDNYDNQLSRFDGASRAAPHRHLVANRKYCKGHNSTTKATRTTLQGPNVTRCVVHHHSVRGVL